MVLGGRRGMETGRKEEEGWKRAEKRTGIVKP
jgi:hypothetical protein